jgi:RecA-family ATPase
MKSIRAPPHYNKPTYSASFYANSKRNMEVFLMYEEKQFTPLSVIDGKSLLALECEPPKFIISRILPTGLSLLSGSPKVGKSWFALWLCQQVSQGLPVWEFETHKSAVLYLALEDTVDRLHFRLSDINPDGSSGSEDNYFTTHAESVSTGLLEQLAQFIKTKPNTGLIVIDTLQRIRGGADENRSSYAFDYEDMNKIKAIADSLKIAILLIHHTRKAPDSDPFNTISGTTGLTGWFCLYSRF